MACVWKQERERTARGEEVFLGSSFADSTSPLILFLGDSARSRQLELDRTGNAGNWSLGDEDEDGDDDEDEDEGDVGAIDPEEVREARKRGYWGMTRNLRLFGSQQRAFRSSLSWRFEKSKTLAEDLSKRLS